MTRTNGSSRHVSPATEALLARDEAERRAQLDPSIVDMSHAEGVPIGTLGSGHSVFGRHGFSRVSSGGPPDMGPDFQSLRFPGDFAFLLSENDVSYVLQERPPVWRHRAARGTVVPLERVVARFPPYPRYTSSWEYLIRMLGLTLDAEFIYLRPFKGLRFELRSVRLASCSLSVRVEPDWTFALVDGVRVTGPVTLRRNVSSHEVVQATMKRRQS